MTRSAFASLARVTALAATFSAALSAQCTNVTLTSQAEVDAFNCTVSAESLLGTCFYPDPWNGGGDGDAFVVGVGLLVDGAPAHTMGLSAAPASGGAAGGLVDAGKVRVVASQVSCGRG
ncbi:MAG: hypothetical protein KAI24_25005 [Planctomycetes bacterium]|nr:hypothetical protein [Planctomycetota bacterium]